MKNLKIIIGVLILLLLISLSIFLVLKFKLSNDLKFNIVKQTPIDKEIMPFKAISFESISKGTYSGHAKKDYYKINNDKEWNDLWKIAYSTVSQQPTLPKIDFENEIVIAVFAGEFPSGGYTTEVKKLEENLKTIQATVENTSPGSSCTTTDALTQPFHIIKTKKIDKEIKFIEVNKLYNCK